MHVRTLVLFGILVVVAVVGLTWVEGEPHAPATFVSEPIASAVSRTVSGAEESPPSFRVVGLMVNAPTHTGADPASSDGFDVELAFFGTFERTRLAVELTLPRGGIVDLVQDASRLERFEDDRGTDLRKEDDPFGPFESLPRLSDDGRHLVFVVPSERLPYPAASRIEAEGEVGVLVADRTETLVSDAVELAAGSVVVVGDLELTVRSVGPSDWGDGHALELSAGSDLADVVRWALRDADGVEHELHRSVTMGGMGVWRHTLEAEALPERAALVVERWSDPETLVLPFSVSAGLGLR